MRNVLMGMAVAVLAVGCSATKDIYLGADQTLYRTDTAGVFWQRPQGGSWQQLDNDMVKFLVDDQGDRKSVV